MTTLLIRHGQSEANVSLDAYIKKTDPKVELTAIGVAQAIEAGKWVNDWFKFTNRKRPINFWVSPFVRTVQTSEHIINQLDDDIKQQITVKQSIYLIERQFGLIATNRQTYHDNNHLDGFKHDYNHHKNNDSQFFCKPAGGESPADLAIRIDQFYRTYLAPIEHESTNILIFHGAAIRAFDLIRQNRSIYDDFPVVNNCSISVSMTDKLTTLFTPSVCTE